MTRILFYIISLCIITEAAEVSVFGAGDINSSNPYGLTKAEKHILKNKKELDSVDSEVKDVKTSLREINQRIDGLESISNGDSMKLNQSTIKLNNLILDVDVNKQDIAALKNVSSQLLIMQEEITAENKKNLLNLKLAIEKLTKLVNKINSRYISEREFKKNMKQFITVSEFNAFKKSLGYETKSSNKANNLAKNDKSKIMSDAKKLFSKDQFTKALPKFEFLVTAKYKPAENGYYLGEIHFYRKKYDAAIKYFKASALLYDKGIWMPKLLLHSAISFEKVNDLDNAATFYSTLIDVYPDSKEADMAYKNLAKIN